MTVIDTDGLAYQMKLAKAMRAPLPVQVKLGIRDVGLQTFVFAKGFARRLANDIAPEITFDVIMKGYESTLTINFGLPWNDRLAFLQTLRQEHKFTKGAAEFFELVNEAERAFVMNIDEAA